MTPRNPGSVGSLALALFHEWNPERIFMLVTVYVDESGTHDSGMTLLGAWVGRLGQWRQFDLRWNRLLGRSKIPYFHSRKMFHGTPPFKGWELADKQAFIKEAVRLVTKHLGFGFTIAMHDEEYAQHYIAGGRPKKIPLDSKYALCVRHAISSGVGMASEFFPNRDLDIHFVMERGHRNYTSAERIFYKIKDAKAEHDQPIARLLRTCTPGDKAEFPGLQVADLNAYSAFQHYFRSPVKVFELETGTAAALKQAKKRQKVPVFNFPLDPRMLGLYRQMAFDEDRERREFGLARTARLTTSRED